MSDLQEALTWAVSELRGETHYEHEGQRAACYDRADEILAALSAPSVTGEALEAAMLAAAKTHDMEVSERERGAEIALRAGNGMATIYWRAIVQAVAASLNVTTPNPQARETIARIINPAPLSDIGCTILREELGRGPKDRADAYKLADRILAALSPTALEQGSGAFPAKEPVIPTEREDGAVVFHSHPTGNRVADALIAGFLHGVGRQPWADMHDYIAVCAIDYVKGDPLPARRDAEGVGMHPEKAIGATS